MLKKYINYLTMVKDADLINIKIIMKIFDKLVKSGVKLVQQTSSMHRDKVKCF